MKKVILITAIIIVAIGVGLLVFLLVKEDANLNTNTVINELANKKTKGGYTVAFIADSGLDKDSQAVLRLIRDEGTDLVLHQGDFNYQDDPDTWDQQINNILGEDFPFLASIGNHDIAAWAGYQKKLEDRLERTTDITCTGDIGVKATCTYQDILIVLSGVGTIGSEHETYLQEQLANSDSTWKICSWHKNQKLMQVGDKKDEVGWQAYEICRKAGAIIATGHEHSYSRTYLMDNFETQSIVNFSSTLDLKPGQSFAFVSGLAGKSIRSQEDKLADNPWWASVYTSDQNANYGALFCTFDDKGNGQASCYFKDIEGNIVDQFELTSNL